MKSESEVKDTVVDRVSVKETEKGVDESKSAGKEAKTAVDDQTVGREDDAHVDKDTVRRGHNFDKEAESNGEKNTVESKVGGEKIETAVDDDTVRRDPRSEVGDALPIRLHKSGLLCLPSQTMGAITRKALEKLNAKRVQSALADCVLHTPSKSGHPWLEAARIAEMVEPYVTQTTFC